ncbi:phosphoprotein phosphatase [Pholiota molesta]|nr:phosphoprotein phosphatase [Pholiota molesta]
MEYPPPANHSSYRPRSVSPPTAHARGFASQARAPIKPVLFQSAPIIRPPSPPPPPKRTEPTKEYIAVSLKPSPRIAEPSQARKLIVLDLNGSLVLRSAHSRRVPPPRGRGAPSSSDPYADPTQQRPLRTVHRRPYLASFAAYVLHEQTKKWLDTMVWSSAQPHSVADMVEHCFGNRVSELKAVWARDTLGLTADDYHKKSLTLKNLEKPWAELPFTDSTTAATQQPSFHSASSTLLIDDSPAKAALQPWNHLCIRDYVQGMRNLDLLVAEREARALSQPAPPHAAVSQQPEPSPAPPAQPPTSTDDDGVHKVTREVVMVDGALLHGAAPAAVQPAKAEEDTAEAEEAAQVVDANAEPEIRYDETLLAVVGVLDHVKHEGNVAGWLRSGGLLHTALAHADGPAQEPATSRKHGAPSRSPSPALGASPAKKARLADAAEEEPPSSPLPTPPPTSQMTEASMDEQASTGGAGAAVTAPSVGLWYEDPAVLRFWADRGRDALKELGIAVESGMVSVPGGVQSARTV